MGFKYTDLAKATKVATVDVGDGEHVVQVTFRHAFITPALAADLATLGGAEGKKVDSLPSTERAAVVAAIARASEHIAQLVTHWDLEGDTEGEMFPLDAQVIATKLPIDFQMRVLGGCLSESRAGEAPAPAGKAG